jgi:hypothetical protein
VLDEPTHPNSDFLRMVNWVALGEVFHINGALLGPYALHLCSPAGVIDTVLRLDRAAGAPSPHRAYFGKTPTGTPAGGQQTAFRLQPDRFVAVFGTTLLRPEFASALRDILVGKGVRRVRLDGGVGVLRETVMMLHDASEVER